MNQEIRRSTLIEGMIPLLLDTSPFTVHDILNKKYRIENKKPDSYVRVFSL